MSRFLSEMTWQEVKDILNDTDLVLIPAGSTEQHGPHLPLNTDSLIAQEVSRRVGKLVKAPIFPILDIGHSIEHLSFPGSISYSPETMLAVIRDISTSLSTHGFKHLVFINAHGGNNAVLELSLQWIRNNLDQGAVLFNVGDIAQERATRAKTKRQDDHKIILHAEKIETSMILSIASDKVKKSLIKTKSKKKKSGLSDNAFIGSLGWSASDLGEDGVIGDPTGATAAEGSALLYYVSNRIAKGIETLKKSW
ncbi:MAG: creatininase family protein [Nitrososphaerales archaeon]